MNNSALYSEGTFAMENAWCSRLLPLIQGKFVIQPVTYAGQTWSIDDYSYVGYLLGAKNLAAVPINRAGITKTGNITRELQDTIDSLARSGGGSVLIPEGSFIISSSIIVPHNNISIEGAGSGKTIIQIPENYNPQQDPYEGVFTFGKTIGKQNDKWISRGLHLSSVSTPVYRGDTHIDADSASNMHVGDWIVLQQYFWQNFVDHNSAGSWPINLHPIPTDSENRVFSFAYLRQITRIVGNRIFVDAPIPWTLNPASNYINIRSTKQTQNELMKENIGLKGVTIQFANQSFNRPRGAAVYFEGVRNGWVQDVKVHNFPRNGIYLRSSARITCLECEVSKAQDEGGGGYGYSFLVYASQNILIKRCYGEGTRHNFLSSRTLTSMLVYTQCTSVNATQPDDTHHSFGQAILWDKHTQRQGNSLEALNRQRQSTDAYETLGSGVIWNFYGDGVKGQVSSGGEIHVKPSPDGQAIITGVTGNHRVFDNSKLQEASGGKYHFIRGEQMLPKQGLQVGSQTTALQNVLYEGIGQSGLQPESLYEALLSNRLESL
jgi:signal peptidase I